MPNIPAVVAGVRGAAVVSADGEAWDCRLSEAAALLRREPVLVCHAPATLRRIGVRPSEAARIFDLLELFAFVRPARFCLPTPRGLAVALDLEAPEEATAEAATLHAAATRLLAELSEPSYRDPAEALEIAATMARHGWVWGPAVSSALGTGRAERGSQSARVLRGLDIWNHLPEWGDPAPTPPADALPVTQVAVMERLDRLLGSRADRRDGQRDYAGVASHAFAPRERGAPAHVVLAEAGTGVGKTLGYIAPASVWAETNGGTVWLSTYTKNLQRQIDQELDRLYPDPGEKRRRVVLRKGRENYLCLLNFREAVAHTVGAAEPSGSPDIAVALGLVARWARHTRDGDMAGGDFPSWLGHLLGRRLVVGLTDRRGECVHSACPHYRRCFIEHTSRRSRQANLVVSNHALVLSHFAGRHPAGKTDASYASEIPARLVFDEGHHLFDAADSAYAVALSGAEMAELRRWLRGNERSGASHGSRRRGLEERFGDLIADDETATQALAAAIRVAARLPGEGWLGRISAGTPHGPAETFLALTRRQVLERSKGRDDGAYDLEVEIQPPLPHLPDAADDLDAVLAEIEQALRALHHTLAERLKVEQTTPGTGTPARIEAARRSLDRRGLALLAAWRSMLEDLGGQTPAAAATSRDFVDWLAISREEGRETDVGLHRHWIDPTVPLARTIMARADGVLITSATLRDVGPEVADDWMHAEVRTGAVHLPAPPPRYSVPSPFDYQAQTRIIVVTDVRRNDMEALAAAYYALFLGAAGGALGIFTSIARLRAVHARLLGGLDHAGIPLYSQHTDAIDTGTLVDIFRAEPDACLLGTDAVRDGVDVPGRSLRLIVCDRVPWPRPSILHKARRQAFGAIYDDLLVRLRLKQAYGRLVRRADDRGLFIILDSATPTRLTTAFPSDVPIERLRLADAVEVTRTFLHS